ncbi:glycosyltransferase family 39 protein [Candidatus Microgenomates bacterium]|nr:glycosyltransferase family 39 protein [Candidatus Microgenomates bacterium]
MKSLFRVISLTAVLFGLLNFFYLVPPVVNWDEGTHAIWGFREWLALKDGNLVGFWEFARQQFAYPPLGSWLIALVNFPSEFSITLARFVSTLGFMAAGILIFSIGRQLNKNKFAGLSAFFFFISSPIILFYSVVVFKEIWGVALSLLFVFFYFRAISQKNLLSYFLAGCSLALLFWEKYNYAGLVFLTLVLESIVEWVIVFANKKNFFLAGKIFLRQLLLFSPLVIFAFWWILTPDNKLEWFLQIMRSDWNPVTVGLGGKLDYLLFYPNSLRVSYVFSEILFWLLLTGYLLSIRDLADKKIRLLFLLFTINLLLGTRHAVNLQDRYILTTVPGLFLLAGFELEKTWLFLRSKRKSKFVKYVICVLFVISGIWMGYDLIKLPWFLKSNATHLLSSAMYEEADYHDTIFNFNKQDWPKGELFLRKNAQTSEQVIDYILDNVDVNKQTEIVGYMSEIAPDWVELRMALRRRKCAMSARPAGGYNLQCTNNKNINNYLVTLEVKTTSRLYTYDYKRANSWAIPKIKEITENNKGNLLVEKDFQELGLIVRVYGF